MTDQNSDAPRWTAARLQWLGIFVAGLLAGLLGLVGFWPSPQTQVQPSGVLDAIYRTAQLFMFQFDDELGPKPWSLEVARFLAPVVTSYTVVLSLLRMMGQRWQLSRLTGHVVVCGLGHKGVYLAKSHLREGKRVAVG